MIDQLSDNTILITGGAGFIGSNFIVYFLTKYPNIRVVNLDKLTYAGDINNLSELSNNPNYTFIEGDICDATLVSKLFHKHEIKGYIILLLL